MKAERTLAIGRHWSVREVVCWFLLIIVKFVVCGDHPFFADAGSGDGLAFGLVEHGGDVLFNGIGPAGEWHDLTTRRGAKLP